MKIPFLKDKDSHMQKAALSVLVLLAVFLLAQTVLTVKETSELGRGDVAEATISFNGTGEVFAVADVATFSFSVTKEADSVEEAQELVEDVVSKATEVLMTEGVEDKDIKTEGYNVYPRYEWINSGELSRGSERVFVGYEVTQSTAVKVRDTEKAGDILGKIGALGVTNVSGLSFEIDDPDDLKRKARALAIEEAKDKAKDLAKDLDVKLVRIVNYFENEGGYYPEPFYAKAESLAFGGATDDAVSPTLSTGEEKIRVDVTIVYEIK